jgi:hypothetical protein
MSLVETLVAVVFLMIAFIGTSSVRYYAALDGRKATERTAASRVALLLCESWRGLAGAESYDPVAYFSSTLAISEENTGPDKPTGFTLLGNYAITLDGANYRATLSWRDVQSGLRALSVVVAWAQRNPGEKEIANMDKSFRLTSYAATL